MAAPRSPRYPNISLSEAIARARAIYQTEAMSTMTPTVAAEAMGYKGISGASLKTISSLKKYGLLEGRGEDVRLTADAQILAIDNPTSPDYRAALVRAANGPEVFGDISKQFQGQASERNIAVYLEKRGFRQEAANLIAKYYKECRELVGGIPPQYSGEENQPPPYADSSRHRMTVRIPSEYPTSPPSVGVGDADAPFRITMDGKKLHIMADVDLDSLQTLKQVLESYENVLKLLKQAADQVKRPPGLFEAGELAPVGGNYVMKHPNGHHADETIVLSKGDLFRPCPVCGNAVIYKQARTLELGIAQE